MTLAPNHTKPTSQELAALIRRLNPSRANGTRDEWIRIGMAIHDADPSDLGYQRFEEFSRQSSKFDLADCRAAWKSFRAGSVTVGTLIALANEDTPIERSKPEPSKRGYSSLKDYAEAHGAPLEAFTAAGWRETTRNGRRAAVFKTANEARWRFLDGGQQAYDSPVDFKRSLYLVDEAIAIAKRTGGPLVLCNGEASAIVGQHHGVAAFAVAGGSEKSSIPDELLAELTQKWHGAILIALDCDATGRKAAPSLATQMRMVNMDARAVDLGGTDGFDLADFCRLHNGTSATAIRGLPALEVQQVQQVQQVQPSRFTVRTLADLASVQPPRWVLPEEAIERGYHLIYGSSGGGKTFYAIDRALRLAAAGKRVLYIATEDLAGLKIRVMAWRKAYPLTSTDTFTWLEMPEGLDLADNTQVDELLSALAPYAFEHITIDTLREAHTGDENSSQDGAAVNRAVQLLIRGGASVDVVHHSGVEDKRPRGTTAVFANADMVLRVGCDGEYVTVHTDKVRNSTAPDDRRFALVTADTGLTDDAGQPIQSAVLRSASAALGSASAKLARAHKSILEALAYSIFAETGAKAQQLIDITELSRRAIYQALSDLKTGGHIVQSAKGDPYFITISGRAQLGPEFALAPEPKPSAEVQTASESPSAASADQVHEVQMHQDAMDVQVLQVQSAVSTALHCTSSPEEYTAALDDLPDDSWADLAERYEAIRGFPPVPSLWSVEELAAQVAALERRAAA